MRPKTTLFILMSLDGKISTGYGNNVDFDSDIPRLSANLQLGVNQYYEIEQTTSIWTLCSGKTKAKLGANELPFHKDRTIIHNVIVDNSHLTEHGIMYLARMSTTLVIITCNKDYLKYHNKENIKIIYNEQLDLIDAFDTLYNKYGCTNLTVQSGGTLNSKLIRLGLIDKLDIVVCPIIVGGSTTPTISDGKASLNLEEVKRNTKELKLKSVELLENSFMRLKYDIIN